MKTPAPCRSLAAVFLFCSPLVAEQLEGVVSAVADKTFTIGVPGELQPVAGDKIEVFVEVPGVGRAAVASGIVSSVEGGVVQGLVLKSSGQVSAGQQVFIDSPKPTRAAGSKVPLVIGRTAAAAKAALTAAGFQVEFAVGVAAPQGVTPFTVYSQDPAVGATLARNAKVTVTLYGQGDNPVPPPTTTPPAVSNPTVTLPPPPPAAVVNRSNDPRDNRFPPAAAIQPDQPWLGASVWRQDEEHVVGGVLEDGPAGKAGIQAGDRILSIEGVEVSDRWNGVDELIATHKAGRIVAVGIQREGQPKTLQVRLEPIPPDGGNGRYLTAAENGQAWAMFEMGMRLSGSRSQWGFLTEQQKNAEQSLQWLQSASDAGSASATYYLGTRYRYGTKAEKDPAKAVQLFQRASEMSQSDGKPFPYQAATSSLAEMYRQGEGVAKNPKKALAMYGQLAHEGDHRSAWQVGQMYELGELGAKDYKQALPWYHSSAKGGYSFAQYSMGEFAYFGRGVQKNHQVALGWFRLAGKQRNAWAKIYEAQMNERGEGTPVNYPEALRLYQEASKAGFTGATIGYADFRAAYLYETQGTKLGFDQAKSRQLAIDAYQKAAKYNDAAKAALKRLAPEIFVQLSPPGSTRSGDSTVVDREIFVQLPPPPVAANPKSELPALSGTYKVAGIYNRVATQFIWRQIDANTAEVTLVLDGFESNVMRSSMGIPQTAKVIARKVGGEYRVESTDPLTSVLTKGLAFTPAGKNLNYKFAQSNGISSSGVATRQ